MFITMTSSFYLICTISLAVTSAFYTNHIDSKCTHGHCCDGQPYQPNYQECCSSEIINKKEGLRCCNGRKYFTHSHECCGETLVPMERCCYGVPYEPVWQKCCNRKVIDTKNGEGCCHDTTVPDDKHVCCGSNIVLKERCCYGVYFDPAWQQCCNNEVIDRNKGEACCYGFKYNKNIHECYNQHVALKGKFCRGGKCCNGKPYQPTRQKCCGKKIINTKKGENCCYGKKYNAKWSVCCNKKVVRKGKCCQKGKCCNGKPYDPKRAKCCNRVIINTTKGFDCCYGKKYNIKWKTCCGKKVVSKGRCCANKAYNSKYEVCCSGYVAPKDVYGGYPCHTYGK